MAWKAGAPLTIETVDLAGPRAGEAEAGANVVGADKIIGIDRNPARERMARAFGMTRFINPKSVDNVVDAIQQLTDGGARGRTDVPKIVGWCMEGKIRIDALITHTLRLEDINLWRLQHGTLGCDGCDSHLLGQSLNAARSHLLGRQVHGEAVQGV